MIGRRRRGLGEYPGYYCYDANRPAWLPYWIDSIAESLCKYNPKTIAGNIAACATGDPTCGTPSGSALDPTLSGPGIAAPGAPTNVPKCSAFYQSFNPATNQCEVSPWVYFGGAGLLLLVAVIRR